MSRSALRPAMVALAFAGLLLDGPGWAQEPEGFRPRPPSDPPPEAPVVTSEGSGEPSGPPDSTGQSAGGGNGVGTRGDAGGSGGEGAGSGGQVMPVRPTFTEGADLIAPGALEFEAGYGIHFDDRTLQVGDLLLKGAISDVMELRAGWYLMGLRETVGGVDRGVGDIYGQVKIPIPVDVTGTHRLAFLGHARPGIGQVPVSEEGLMLAALACYSTELAPIRIDATAGFEIHSLLADEPIAILPLSGQATWRAQPWLELFGEVVERLALRDLSFSSTQLLLGGAWRPSADWAIDASLLIGLSEALPDSGFQLGLATRF